LNADGRIWWGTEGRNRPGIKRFLSEVKQGVVPQSLWQWKDVGSTRHSKQEISTIMEATAASDLFETPKPSGLIYRVLQIGSDPEAIVLDSFAGSGTTAQAVLALNKEDGGNRKFILVECEDYADTITAERVRRVISGVPGAKDKSLKEGLGGSFTYCTLGQPIDVEGMLTGGALPQYSELAAYLLHTSAGISAGAAALERQNDDGLFYSSDTTDYYLLYRPDIEWLRSNDAILNEQQARRIKSIGNKAVVFAADKYMGQRFLTSMDITFCQIPYELHQPVRV